MLVDVGGLLIIGIVTGVLGLISSRRHAVAMLRIEELEEVLAAQQRAEDLVQCHLLDKIEAQRVRMQSLEARAGDGFAWTRTPHKSLHRRGED